MPAGNISAGLGNSAAGVFNERTDDQIGSDRARLLLLNKLSVTVIDKDDRFGTCFTDRGNDGSDRLDRKRGAGRIAAAALNMRELGALDRFFDGFIVRRPCSL